MKSTFPYLPGTSHPCPVSSSPRLGNCQLQSLPCSFQAWVVVLREWVGPLQVLSVVCPILSQNHPNFGGIWWYLYNFDPYLRLKNTENHPTSSNYRPEMAKLCSSFVCYHYDLSDEDPRFLYRSLSNEKSKRNSHPIFPSARGVIQWWRRWCWKIGPLNTSTVWNEAPESWGRSLYECQCIASWVSDGLPGWLQLKTPATGLLRGFILMPWKRQTNRILQHYSVLKSSVMATPVETCWNMLDQIKRAVRSSAHFDSK